MKSVLSSVLVVSLVVPPLADAAQPRSTYGAGLSNWARVRTIVPGSQIRAIYVGRRADRQYFISATDDEMTVLTAERLPRAARKAVIRIAATHPEFFTAARWTELTEGSVRLTPDGVFFKAHRIAGIDDIVTTVAADDVLEITREVRAPNRRHRPPYSGIDSAEEKAAVGSSVGLTYLLLATCGESCPTWSFFAAWFGPLVAGVAIAARHTERQTEIVYRAS